VVAKSATRQTKLIAATCHDANLSWAVYKTKAADSQWPSAAKQTHQELLEFFGHQRGLGLALANDLTVPFPTPQKRQPFEVPLEARGKQGKQVCPSASLGTSRTPRKHPLAALSDVIFIA